MHSAKKGSFVPRVEVYGRLATIWYLLSSLAVCLYEKLVKLMSCGVRERFFFTSISVYLSDSLPPLTSSIDAVSGSCPADRWNTRHLISYIPSKGEKRQRGGGEGKRANESRERAKRKSTGETHRHVPPHGHTHTAYTNACTYREFISTLCVDRLCLR